MIRLVKAPKQEYEKINNPDSNIRTLWLAVIDRAIQDSKRIANNELYGTETLHINKMVYEQSQKNRERTIRSRRLAMLRWCSEDNTTENSLNYIVDTYLSDLQEVKERTRKKINEIFKSPIDFTKTQGYN